jgi:hypothetical protein
MITIQSDAVVPVLIRVDGNASWTPYSFLGQVGASYTLTVGNLSVSTSTGRSEFTGWSGGANSASRSLTFTVGSDLTVLASYKSQYLVHISFADFEGRSLSPQNVSIQGPEGTFKLTNSSLWLNPGSYQVTQADWIGVNVGADRAVPGVFEIAQSASVVVTLPVYDETILVNDVYFLPISGANVTMSVGDQIQQVMTNSTGLAVFRQVPLGYLNGTVRYLGFSAGVRISNPGEGTERVTVTLSYPVLITILTILAVGACFTVWKTRRKPVPNSELFALRKPDRARVWARSRHRPLSNGSSLSASM